MLSAARRKDAGSWVERSLLRGLAGLAVVTNDLLLLAVAAAVAFLTVASNGRDVRFIGY